MAIGGMDAFDYTCAGQPVSSKYLFTHSYIPPLLGNQGKERTPPKVRAPGLSISVSLAPLRPQTFPNSPDEKSEVPVASCHTFPN